MEAEPSPPSVWLLVAILAAVLAVPWAVAVRLLWGAWRRDYRHPVHHGQGRAGVAAGCRGGHAARCPSRLGGGDDRRAGSGAGSGVTLVVRGRLCPVAVFPPRSSRVPLLVVGVCAAVAVVAAGLAVGAALPAMREFAVTFVALLGAAATLVAARSRRVRPPGLAVAAAGLAGVAGCITIAAYVLARYRRPGRCWIG